MYHHSREYAPPTLPFFYFYVYVYVKSVDLMMQYRTRKAAMMPTLVAASAQSSASPIG